VTLLYDVSMNDS